MLDTAITPVPEALADIAGLEVFKLPIEMLVLLNL